ncbi:MAG: iron-sulfur cluster assembly scaffold protein [Clostridia bacterium]|nr:iron-sulfur cluster assembly scaffold protein [Clostridia bacterium]
MYNATILARLENLENAGIISGADAVGQVGSVVTGTMIKFYLRIQDGVITEAKFKTLGGVFALVACDIVCEFLANTDIETALTINSEDIIKAMNGVPENKLYIIDLAQSAIVDAVDDYYKKLARAKLNQKK